MNSKKNRNPIPKVPVKLNNLKKDEGTNDINHLGSSNAFEETENPISRENDDISDEKLDEILDA